VGVLHTTFSIKNQKGMSLVGVLAASAISIIIISNFSAMTFDFFKAQRSVQSKLVSRDLTTRIQQLLLDPSICKASFNGENPADGFIKNKIIDAAIPANIKYETGVNYMNNLLQITSFEVKNFSADSLLNNNVGKSELIIKMKKMGATTGVIEISDTIILHTSLNAANNIKECYALGKNNTLDLGSK